MDTGGFWDEGKESPTEEHSRTCQSFCGETSRNTAIAFPALGFDHT